MSENEQKVAIVTGGSQGIGAGIVTGYRDRGWAVVVNALTVKPADDPAIHTVAGDISEPATAERIVTEALGGSGASTRWSTTQASSFPRRSLITAPRTTPWWSAST